MPDTVLDAVDTMKYKADVGSALIRLLTDRTKQILNKQGNFRE